MDYPNSFATEYSQGLINPCKRVEVSYEDLALEEANYQDIGAIFYLLAHHGQIWIISHRPYLIGIGDRISHIHPLKFIETIVRNRRLKEYYILAWNDFFKSRRLKYRLSKSFEGKLTTKSLLIYVEDFCAILNLNEKMVTKYITHREWMKLVEYVLECAHPLDLIADEALFSTVE